MSQYQSDQMRTFTCAEAVTENQLVGINSSGALVVNVLNTRPIGFAMRDGAIGESVPVRLFYPTYVAIAKEAFAAGATLYTEVGGKVQDTAESTGLPMFVALEAAAAENDLVEVLPIHYGGVAAP